MKCTRTALPDVVLIEPDVFGDARGFFMETYHQDRYAQWGIDRLFVQDNYSHSRRGTLRGLHYQFKKAQAKLVYVIQGEIFDVAVDIRKGSPTFGEWMGTHLSGQNRRQVFVPEGFAHGFCVLSDTVDVIYKCAAFYDPTDEYGILWNDPSIGIAWPVSSPILSVKDGKSPLLSQVPEAHLPVYEAGKTG